MLAAIASEIFAERRAGHRPLHLSDAFQSETFRLQSMNFNNWESHEVVRFCL